MLILSVDSAAVLGVLHNAKKAGEMLPITIKTIGIYPLKGGLDAGQVGNPSLRDL